MYNFSMLKTSSNKALVAIRNDSSTSLPKSKRHRVGSSCVGGEMIETLLQQKYVCFCLKTEIVILIPLEVVNAYAELYLSIYVKVSL